LNRSAFIAAVCASVTACGDSTSDSTGSSPEASAPDSASGLFTDPSVPTCVEGKAANTLIVGSVSGQSVSLMEGGPSELDGQEYFALGASGTANSNPMLWRPLDLKWQGSLVEGQAVALSGGYVSLKPDQKYAPYDCITAGEFGPRPLSSLTAVGRTFRFRVTAMVEGSLPDGSNNLDCSGAAVAANLSGCIYRTKTYLPTSGAGAGGTQDSGPVAQMGGAGGSSGSAGGGPTAPSGLVQHCFGTACPHGPCNNAMELHVVACSMVYSAPVDANSSYCAAGATGAYCLTVGPDAFNETSWLVECANGTATLKDCPPGCQTLGAGQPAMCN